MAPQFYKVAGDIFPSYNEKGYIESKYNVKMMVQNFVNDRFNQGDILYVGSSYETRQYSQAFVIIMDGCAVGYEDCAVNLPIHFKTPTLNYSNMLSTAYENMHTTTETDEDDENYEFGQWFFNELDYETVHNMYEINGLL